MPDGIRWVALDVHARQSTIAIFDQATGEVQTRRVVGRPHAVMPLLREMQRPAGWSTKPVRRAMDWRAGRWRRGSSPERHAVRCARAAASGPIGSLSQCRQSSTARSTPPSRCCRSSTAGSAQSWIEARRGLRIRGKRPCSGLDLTAVPTPSGGTTRWLSSTLVAVGCDRYRRRRMPAGDRVQERRRAAALARHYREAEGLSIREISRRLGRAEATVKAYLYDPSQANKRPRCP